MKIEHVHDAIYRIRTPFYKQVTVFLYLIKGDRIALVDTGAAHSPREVIQPALAEIGLALSDVDLVLNTHGHLDHIGGNLALKRISNASIHTHSADRLIAESEEAHVEFMVAPLRAFDVPAELLKRRSDYIKTMLGETTQIDVSLSDGDTIELGANIKLNVIHSPGHTPGAVSFYWESEGVLLAGDAIQGQGGRPGIYPYYDNALDYRKSLVKLSQLDIRHLCMAHCFAGGGVINDPTRTGADCKALIHASIQVADTIHKAVADVMRHMPCENKRDLAQAVLAELIYDIPQLRLRDTQLPANAAPSLLSHINMVLSDSYPES